jgi:hypothetical protein
MLQPRSAAWVAHFAPLITDLKPLPLSEETDSHSG